MNERESAAAGGIDLLGALPPFVTAYRETAAVLAAEEPEFAAAWEAAARVLRNAFVLTADEDGLARFEALLGVRPARGETAQARRARVWARWINGVPYTERALRERLAALSGGAPVSLSWPRAYTLAIGVCLELPGQLAELRHILDEVLPCAVTVEVRNSIPCAANGPACLAGAVCAAECVRVTDGGAV